MLNFEHAHKLEGKFSEELCKTGFQKTFFQAHLLPPFFFSIAIVVKNVLLLKHILKLLLN